MNTRDRILGGLWGALVGDALGVPVEFKDRAERKADPVTDMREFGSHGQPKGTWSDDGSLILCTVDSLVRHEFDTEDMGKRFVGWYREELWTPHGKVFDVGLTTSQALARVATGMRAEVAGDTNFLQLLEELRAVLPKGKLLSVAAYPPPTWWHPYEDVHWDEKYLREVARRSDQLAVMMYDAAQRIPKTYQRLMADWTQEVLAWSEGKPMLLGVPTYDDAGAGYHDPKVENLTNALLGIHGGLSRQPVPANYQGVAIYCEWETSETEWQYFREHFLDQTNPAR